MNEEKEPILIHHITTWFDSKGKLDKKYLLNESDALGLVGNLCGFDSKTSCKNILVEFIKNDTFFKLFKISSFVVKKEHGYKNENFKTGDNITIYFSLFQLLLFSLDKFEDHYRYYCLIKNIFLPRNIFNDILEISKCLVKISKLEIENIDYHTLFLKFKQSGILDYTLSYDIILDTELYPNLQKELNYGLENKLDKKEYIKWDNEKKKTYEEILSNLIIFCENIKNLIEC